MLQEVAVRVGNSKEDRTEVLLVIEVAGAGTLGALDVHVLPIHSTAKVRELPSGLEVFHYVLPLSFLCRHLQSERKQLQLPEFIYVSHSVSPIFCRLSTAITCGRNNRPE